MGLRFRKSITIAPGVRINYGLHSSSISFGGKGFRTTYSSTGRVTRSVGIPGTGLSYVTSSGGSRSTGSRPSRNRRNNPGISGATGAFATGAMGQQQSAAAQPAVQQSISTVDTAEVRARIHNIFRFADNPVDWKRIAISSENPGIEQWEYFKARAEDVLNGELDTYFEIIEDINPVDDLLQYGSEFECGTDDPRMLTVEFQVNSDSVLREAVSLPANTYNDLLQDYVCGCSIRVARDITALLPIRHVIINAYNRGQAILSVDFDRGGLAAVDYESADASDVVEAFPHRMEFTLTAGFSPIQPLDEL